MCCVAVDPTIAPVGYAKKKARSRPAIKAESNADVLDHASAVGKNPHAECNRKTASQLKYGHTNDDVDIESAEDSEEYGSHSPQGRSAVYSGRPHIDHFWCGTADSQRSFSRTEHCDGTNFPTSTVVDSVQSFAYHSGGT